MVLVLALIAVLFVLGFALHTLIWVALIALAVWLVLVLVRPSRGRGRRWYSL
jgi:Flp pilus assembly protein TadB